MNEIVKVKENAIIEDINQVKEVCEALRDTPHHKRLGTEGLYGVVEKAISLGISPLEALNGGVYFVQGKVEMTSSMMNQMIRGGHLKHSITKDKRSDDTICILHGKRADSGDTWVESFSIEEAKTAGIYRNQWLKYPKDMLFARALSRLARQLFPDVIKGAYVQGEISDIPTSEDEPEKEVQETITQDQHDELMGYLENNNTLKANILKFMNDKWGIIDFRQMPYEIYDHALTAAKKQHSQEETNDNQ